MPNFLSILCTTGDCSMCDGFINGENVCEHSCHNEDLFDGKDVLCEEWCVLQAGHPFKCRPDLPD